MVIKIERHYFGSDYVIGRCYVGDTLFCDTLEPPLHGARASCILQGEYLVNLVWSPKFKSYKPRLENVPYRSGILIHSGNTVNDTLGCILVGDNSMKGRLTCSRTTYNDLLQLITQAIIAGEKISVKVVNDIK